MDRFRPKPETTAERMSREIRERERHNAKMASLGYDLAAATRAAKEAERQAKIMRLRAKAQKAQRVGQPKGRSDGFGGGDDLFGGFNEHLDRELKAMGEGFGGAPAGRKKKRSDNPFDIDLSAWE